MSERLTKAARAVFLESKCASLAKEYARETDRGIDPGVYFKAGTDVLAPIMNKMAEIIRWYGTLHELPDDKLEHANKMLAEYDKFIEAIK